jgi:hypothetical protein
VLATLAAFTGFGLLVVPPQQDDAVWRPPAQVSWGAAFLDGRVRLGGNAAHSVTRALTVLPTGYDKPTILVDSGGPWQSYFATKFLSALRRDGNSLDGWAGVPLDGIGSEHLLKVVRSKAVPVRIVVTGLPEVAADLTAYAQANPRVGLEVVILS